MDKLRSTVGALAAWVGRPMPWLQATLARGPAGEEDPKRGQGLAEYALILAFIAIVAIARAGLLRGAALQRAHRTRSAASIGGVVQDLP